MRDPTDGNRDGTTVALVLTHSRPDLLATCLEAIGRQIPPPEEVLVVDNASSPAVEAPRDFPTPVAILRLSENLGPAGGYAAGLNEFVRSGHRYAWVMDDDCVPAEGCLRQLEARARESHRPALFFPTEFTPGRGVTSYPGWSGLLLDREIVESVGVPKEELFWWAEDTEYLLWRIPQAGFETVRVPEALLSHPGTTSRSRMKPPWQCYYEVRNTIAVALYLRWKLVGKRRIWLASRLVVRQLGRIVLREDRKLEKLLMFARGVVDGVLGRLGRRVPVP